MYQQVNKSEQANEKTLIQLSFLQKNFQKSLELINNHISQFGQSKEIFILRARSNSQLNKPQNCLQDTTNALKLGASLKQVANLRIRSFIQLSQPYEAQKQFNKLLADDKQLNQLIKLSKAISYAKDPFQIHKLPPKEDQIMKDMNQWLHKSGANYPKLKTVNFSPDYRGVMAIRHIKKGEQIVFIPKSQLITLQMAKNTKINKLLIQKKVKLQSPKHTYLALLLLQLKNTANCKFKPYLDILPTDHSSFPINYTKQELALLQGSPFLTMIYQKVIDLKRDYESVVRSDPANQKYTFKQFCWARMMVGSRIFGILVSGVKTQILVPFADMLNHRQPKQTVWNYQQSMNGFVIQSLEDIEVGEQVFDSYGRKCNSRFLLNYGFILEDNSDNQVSFRLTIDPNDLFAKLKKQMMKQNPNQQFVMVKKTSLNLNSNKFYQLMGCLRFICVDEQQTLNMLKKISNIQATKQPYSIIRTPPISLKNQTKIWQKLASLCEQLLKKYPNTLQDDQKLLKNKQMTQNLKNIINLRAGEKQILQQFVKMGKQVSALLKSQNIVDQLQKSIHLKFSRYLYKILLMTPGVNKKNIQKRISVYFSTQSNEQNILQQTQEVPQN